MHDRVLLVLKLSLVATAFDGVFAGRTYWFSDVVFIVLVFY